MGECANCSVFTDNPAEKHYQYCDDCQERFERIERNGVVVQQTQSDDNYVVTVNTPHTDLEGGTESNHVDALARGKHLSERIGCDALYVYSRNGSKWTIEKFLQEHPSTRARVISRLSKLPNSNHRVGLWTRIKRLFA